MSRRPVQIGAFANRTEPICFSPFLYDKLADSYLVAFKLVAIRIWLRGNESTS